MSLDELVKALAAADKNVLILDTCIVLDVIRSPLLQSQTRKMMPVLAYAVRIQAEIQNNTLPFLLVLPSLFGREWNDNVHKVCEDLQQKLEEHRVQSSTFSSLHQLLHGSPLTIPNVTTYAFADDLKSICEKIISSASSIEEQEQCIRKARQRVVESRPPASRGKQEYKDCEIFEDVLAIGHELRSKGFTRKIVFASSNTSEYGQTGRPLPEIKTDLDAINAEFATLLNIAYHVAAS